MTVGSGSGSWNSFSDDVALSPPVIAKEVLCWRDSNFF